MKSVVITGSTRGIGFGLAAKFLERGLNVAVNGTSEESVHSALEKLSAFKEQILGVQGKTDDRASMERLFDKALEQFGNVDIWINNAGINQPRKMAWELEAMEVGRIIDVNIMGMINGTSVAYNKMLHQGHGKIFNMEGLGSDGRIEKKMAVYGTSKCALSYYTKAFAKENSYKDIQVGLLSPGMVLTDFMTNALNGPPEDVARFKKIFNILGDDVDTVTTYLADGILKSKKNYDHIRWLSPGKVMMRFMSAPFSKRNFFTE